MIQSNRNKAIISIRQPDAAQNSSKLNQGGSNVLPLIDPDLTNCSEPDCYICTMHKGGYPSIDQIQDGHIKLTPYHKKQLAQGMLGLIELISRGV